MARKISLVLWLAATLVGCGDDASDSEPDASADAQARDARSDDDASGEDDAGACPSSGSGTLALSVELESGIEADVRILEGARDALGRLGTSGEHTLDAGPYRVTTRRVRKTSDLVGPAYQGAVEGSADVCVSAGKITRVRVKYTREPGSTRLWLTQSNGDGAQVMAFDAEQLAARGDQTPSVGLAPALNSVGPIRVDGLGRLWVGSTTGRVVGYATNRLGTSSTTAPDIQLEGSSLCERSLPCGPRAMAFDAQGALWIATLSRIVKLAPESLARSGEPSAAVTITSPDFAAPNGLAFDAEGSLWVGESDGAIVKFAASRLAANLVDAPADVVIFGQVPGPVMIGLGSPEGLVFDSDGNLWVGYFAGNDLVRFSKSELGTSAPEDDPIIPSVHIKIGVEALVTDLALDESGNLWLPGGAGALYRIAKDQLSADEPMLTSLRSAQIGSVEKITFNTVPGALFIAP